MTQSNICKHCKKGLVPNHYYLFGRYLCMKNSKTIGTSFSPEKESQSSIKTETPSIAETRKTFIDGTLILTAGNIRNNTNNKFHNNNSIKSSDKFISLSLLESKKAEIEDIIHGSLDHGRVREAEAQLSLLNELMEIKQ